MRSCESDGGKTICPVGLPEKRAGILILGQSDFFLGQILLVAKASNSQASCMPQREHII